MASLGSTRTLHLDHVADARLGEGHDDLGRRLALVRREAQPLLWLLAPRVHRLSAPRDPQPQPALLFAVALEWAQLSL